MSDAPAPTRSPFAALGPGIVFAGAAIGVSHLVQSTRAGAVYGLSLVGLVVLAHVMKLPAMLFGPRYAAATGRSLVHAYRDQGRHAIAVFAVIQIGTMFTIQAAVTAVTAALLGGVVIEPLASKLGLPTPVPTSWVAGGVLVACAVPLAIGGYRWLDRVVKALMVVMAVSTLAAAATQVPDVLNAGLPVLPRWDTIDAAWIMFAVALIGWMPAPLDISVWHSLWSVARSDQRKAHATRRQCDVDFIVGYALCIVLALSFIVLGAALLHRPGIEPAPGGGAFAAQLIGLYTDALGEWSRPVIAVSAIAIMFSTTLTVLDAIPRTLAELRTVLRPSATTKPPRDPARTGTYWLVLTILAGGAWVIIAVFAASMRTLVDVATTLSFLGTPVLAWLNHRAMQSVAVPVADRPTPFLRAWSFAGIVFWLGFAVLYLWQTRIA